MDVNRQVFVALGGVWLDEIRWRNREPMFNVPGGSIVFATLGARLFASNDPKSITMALRLGNDFPEHIVKLFQRWQVQLATYQEHELPAARGILHYGNTHGERVYERLTEPLPVGPSHLASAGFLQSQIVHFFDTPSAVTRQLGELTGLRNHSDPDLNRLFIIWEPQAKSCSPATINEHFEALRLVDVFSPNHAELASFFEEVHDESFNAAEVENQASIFLDAGIGPQKQGCIVVRAAEYGCMILSPNRRNAVWLPSYYPNDSPEVVDPTGAGNAFLGGFAMGYHKTRDFIEAAKYGQVAASLAIEQVGLPELQAMEHSSERWNGVKVQDRLEKYGKDLGE